MPIINLCLLEACRALLNLLFPEVFVHSDAFDATFDLANMSVNHQLLLKANRLLKPLMIRRVKADVEKSLPPKLETKISCKCSILAPQAVTLSVHQHAPPPACTHLPISQASSAFMDKDVQLADMLPGQVVCLIVSDFGTRGCC